MRKIIYTGILLMAADVIAQELPSFQSPEPSKVYEFTKYDQVPVGEYTGVPNIGIPLHNIKVDDVEIPIGLQYHAGGFRVSEEASNIGLGWNMNFGMITQTINDKDDLESNYYTKKLFKYQDSPTIGEWPIKCKVYGFDAGPSFACSPNFDCNPEPSFPVGGALKITNSIFIATDGAYPVDGISYCSTDALDLINWDLEPDVFRANFFGHSLKFIKKFTGIGQGQIEILNDKGYKIEMISNNDGPNQQNWYGTVNWKITTPNGDQYVFGKQRQDSNQSNTWGNPLSFYPNDNPGSTTGGNSYTNNWSLIQVITNKNKAVSFEYNDFGITPSRTYNQTFMKVTNLSSYKNSDGSFLFTKGFYGPPPANQSGTNEYLVQTVNASYEKMLYVSKITTPNETVNFQYSGRDDRGNDKKMDQITVKNNKNEVIKTFQFAYGYFIASQNGGDIVAPANGTYTTDQLRRLKLLSVQQLGQNPYLFEYSPVQLPKKTSNAVDFWGFYNGQINNTSLVPNPATIGSPSMGNNGNDKSAYENYAKACVLEKITYPTGGKIVYEYELNSYDKTVFEQQVPNAGNVFSNTIKGYGIRVKNISLYDRGVLQKATKYSYSGGKCLTPFEIKNSYSSATSRMITNATDEYSTFTMNEFFSSNFIQPTLMGSFNAIGYDKVTSERISVEGNGKTVWTFMNVRDDKPYYDVTNCYNKARMPSLMKINTTENGKVLSEEAFDKNGAIVLKKEFSYTTKQSNIHYGNSLIPFRSTITYQVPQPNEKVPKIALQELVCYYPIYGKQSLMASEKVTEYFSTGSKWKVTNYNYNANNLLTSILQNDEESNNIDGQSTVYNTDAPLVAKNWLNLPQQKTFIKDGNVNTLKYTYLNLGSLRLPETVELLPANNPAAEFKRKIIYDLYDVMGNTLQFHNENGISTAVIWGYNKSLPIAKIENAVYSQVGPYVVNLQNLSDTGTEDNLIVALNGLRAALPDAFVTSFTYIPSIGISTITDPKGDKVTYVFDEYYRLKYVKDKDNNILSENEYHYRPQD